MANYGFRERFRVPRTPFSFPVRDRWPRPSPLLSESLLLPPSQQPPPMFGPRGTTIPPKFHNINPGVKLIKNMNESGNDDQHWCETCDRGFNTMLLLENHKMQHQRCNIDGCPFIAHPKVITKHIQMQHSSGLYKKISKLSDPEEIKKWRDERRMKFPTKANIDKNNAAIKEKIQRGEKMGLRKKTFPDNSKVQKKNSFDGIKRSAGRRRPKKVETACPANKAKHSLPAFTGINQLITENENENNKSDHESNFIIDDEMEETAGNNTQNENIHTNAVCGAISNLIANYASSDEDDIPNIVNTIIEITKQSTTLSSRATSVNSSHETTKNYIAEKVIDPIGTVKAMSPVNANVGGSDDSGPEEIKTVKTKDQSQLDINIVTKSNSTSENKCKINTKSAELSKAKRHQNLSRKLPSSLLEKLLSNEIRHERNITLQCIRYVIKNNYFEK